MHIIEAWGYGSGISNVFSGNVTYEKVKNYFEARQQRRRQQYENRVKIGNNTLLVKKEGSYAIRLYRTDIIELFPNGEIWIDGADYSNLTRSRLTLYLPFYYPNDKGVRYISKGYEDGKFVYATNIVVMHKNGNYSFPSGDSSILKLVQSGASPINLQFLEKDETFKKEILKLVPADLPQGADLAAIIKARGITEEPFIFQLLSKKASTGGTSELAKVLPRKAKDQKLLKKFIAKSIKDNSFTTFYELLKKLRKAPDNEDFIKKLLTVMLDAGISSYNRSNIQTTIIFLFNSIADIQFLKTILLKKYTVLCPLINGLQRSIKDAFHPLNKFGDAFLTDLFYKQENKETDEVGNLLRINVLKFIRGQDAAKKLINHYVENQYWPESVLEKLKDIQDDEFKLNLLSNPNMSTEISLPILKKIEDPATLKMVFEDKERAGDVRREAEKRYLEFVDDIPLLKKVALFNPHYRELVLNNKKLKQADPDFVNKLVKRSRWGKDSGDKQDLKQEGEDKLVNHKKQILRLLLTLAV